MLKKILAILTVLLVSLGSFSSISFGGSIGDSTYKTKSQILTSDLDSAVGEVDGGIEAGVKKIGEGIDGIKQASENSTDDFMNYIQNIVNYFLSILGLVALVYLIYGGFLAVSAAGNDERFGKGIGTMKTGVIAIAGIGISYLVVTFIFGLVMESEDGMDNLPQNSFMEYLLPKAYAADFPYDTRSNATSDIGSVIKDVNLEDDSIIDSTLDEIGMGSHKDKSAVDYISDIVNIFLGIAGTIATIVIIWGFYMMLTTDDYNAGFEKARNTIVKAFIALVVMGLSWFLINWMFGVIQGA